MAGCILICSCRALLTGPQIDHSECGPNPRFPHSHVHPSFSEVLECRCKVLLLPLDKEYAPQLWNCHVISVLGPPVVSQFAPVWPGPLLAEPLPPVGHCPPKEVRASSLNLGTRAMADPNSAMMAPAPTSPFTASNDILPTTAKCGRVQRGVVAITHTVQMPLMELVLK